MLYHVYTVRDNSTEASANLATYNLKKYVHVYIVYTENRRQNPLAFVIEFPDARIEQADGQKETDTQTHTHPHPHTHTQTKHHSPCST